MPELSLLSQFFQGYAGLDILFLLILGYPNVCFLYRVIPGQGLSLLAQGVAFSDVQSLQCSGRLLKT